MNGRTDYLQHFGCTSYSCSFSTHCGQFFTAKQPKISRINLFAFKRLIPPRPCFQSLSKAGESFKTPAL